MADINNILVNPIGNDAQSYMITDEVIGHVAPGKSYLGKLDGLIETEKAITKRSKLVKPESTGGSICAPLIIH